MFRVNDAVMGSILDEPVIAFRVAGKGSQEALCGHVPQPQLAYVTRRKPLPISARGDLSRGGG